MNRRFLLFVTVCLPHGFLLSTYSQSEYGLLKQRGESDGTFYFNTASWCAEGKEKITVNGRGNYQAIANFVNNKFISDHSKFGFYAIIPTVFYCNAFAGAVGNQANIVLSLDFYHTLWGKMLLFLTTMFILFLIFRVRIYWYLNQKKLLTVTIGAKARELALTNKALQNAKDEVLKQNAALRIHQDNLEQLVKIRTEDLERAKRDAEESDRLKTAFLANLSHEIRTPMNAIIGFSTLIQLEEFSEEQKMEFVKLIGQSSESLLSLIDDIIDISRIETGNVKIVRRHTHIPSLIIETINELSFEHRSEAVSLKQNLELKPEDEYIYTDKHRLKQVLSNLLRNAFKYTKEGHVKLSARIANPEELEFLGFGLNGIAEASRRSVLFVVEDTGIGIQKSDFEIIFQSFRKADLSAEFYNGMGLGLNIVKNLVLLLGGDIIVHSELDKGTTFSFYIDINI